MVENSKDLIYLIVILIAVSFPFVLIAAVRMLNDFSCELKYLNCEISRTKGAEQKHWRRVRRKLWLSLIPFVKY